MSAAGSLPHKIAPILPANGVYRCVMRGGGIVNTLDRPSGVARLADGDITMRILAIDIGCKLSFIITSGHPLAGFLLRPIWEPSPYTRRWRCTHPQF